MQIDQESRGLSLGRRAKMNLRRLLGLSTPEETATGRKIGVIMTDVTLPLDIVLELAFRQQSQLFSEFNNLKAQIAVGEAVVSAMGEANTHLHDDMVELQRAMAALRPDKPEKLLH